jgi:hypothetical protein
LSAADLIIDKLLTLEGFLDQIEDFFSNHQEAEEACRSLLSLRQGKKNIVEFNLQFNTLLYMVKLSKASKCEVYESAINPKNN